MNRLIEQPVPYSSGIRSRFISSWMVLVTLLSIAAGFVLISGVTRVLRWFVIPRDGIAWNATLLFDINLEHNFPSYYSSILLLISGILVLYISFRSGQAGKNDFIYWRILSAIFVFLSMDEMIEIHGTLNEPLRDMLNTSGAFHYAWVIPYAIIFMAIVLAYWRFLLGLPRRTRKLFVLSGSIYVLGALGMEMSVGYVVSELSSPRVYMVAALMEHIEEFMEMAGVSLFIYASVVHISMIYGAIVIPFRPDFGACSRTAAR